MGRIKRRLLPAMAILIFMAAACGVNGANPTPSTTEGFLLIRAQNAFGAVSAGNWDEVYGYISPRSQERCAAEEYSMRVINYLGIVRGFVGLPEDAPLKLQPIVRTVTGNAGIVAINFFSNGKRLNFQEDEQFRWVFFGGEWWLEHEFWEGGCSGWKLFEELRDP